MDFDPTRRTCDVLAMILCAPTLHKTHTNSTHLRQLVDGLEALVHRVCEELCKLLVVEDFEVAVGRDFTDSGGVEAVRMVTLSTLDENGIVTQALRKDFSSHVKQVDASPNVPTDVLNGGITVDVGKQP